ncbi:Pleiotropic regulatory protein [Candidatus Desulfarcum epimagneticum]|uniref:Pleiotropic regulatory protein n=1 Tax=uncultured Desulfobacteraceae bacterium TaxID=218296 RepID=A0A484HJB7_9BACT|nr:Pleiotropic regulatory protein [uncultured Desulfobacteraceae bacterium]
MEVQYLELCKQFNDDELWSKIKDVFSTCQFIMGPEVEAFETSFARLCGVPYALGVNSGTDALFLALKALGIGDGDEVITAPNSFIATTGAIVASGARPVFVDVGQDYNMDVNLIEPAITSRTKAIIPVHLTGYPADMPAIMDIAKKRGLYVVEDAAQAVSASIQGKPVGSFGDIGCFSLHPLKNLNACGDAGALTTKSEEIYHKLKMLRNHGLKNRDEIEFFGYNSRMDTVQAIVALHVMKSLPDVIQKRCGNAARYEKGLHELAPEVIISPREKNFSHVFHTYIIQVKRRDKLAIYLADKGVRTKVHYLLPIHLQKPCMDMGYKKGDFPVCEAQSKEIISLPIHQFLTDDQVEYVVSLLRRFYS